MSRITRPTPWATDANFDAPAKAWDGAPTKVLAPTGYQESGFVPGDLIPSDWVNYLIEEHRTAIDVVQEVLDASASEFLMTPTDTYSRILADMLNVRAASLAACNYTTLATDFDTFTASAVGCIRTSAGVRRIVVGCTNGSIFTSDDEGRSWTVRTSNTTKQINAFANQGPSSSTIVAVCDDAEIVTSSDGATWTARTSGATGTPDINDVTYSSGLALFVAVGDVDPTNAYIATSPTGVTWTKRTFTVTGANADLVSVAASTRAGAYAGVIAVSAARAFASADAATWSAAGVDITGIGNHTCVRYIEHRENPAFVILGDDTGAAVSASSVDGAAWATSAIDSPFGSTSGLVAVPFSSVIAGADTGAVAFTTVGTIARLADPKPPADAILTGSIVWDPIGLHASGTAIGFPAYCFGQIWQPSGVADTIYVSLQLGAYLP